MKTSSPLLCLYEDRSSHEVAVQLLVLSVLKFHPEYKIRLHFPFPSSELVRWIAPIGNITLVTTPIEGAGSYNVKPRILLNGLDTGAKSCLWLDTDIIVAGKLCSLSQSIDDTLISSLDPWPDANGSTYRAKAFGLTVQAKAMPGAVNSAVLLVTPAHRELLEDWADLLREKNYQKEQLKPVSARNPMMLGDQDALSALIASEKYATLHVKLLQHPAEILQHQGVAALSIQNRLKIKRHQNLPSLIHAMASIKPWMLPVAPILNGLRAYYQRIFIETSPYLFFAREYQDQIIGDKSWLKIRTPYAIILLFLTKNNTVMAGAPQAIFHQSIDFIRRFSYKKRQ